MAADLEWGGDEQTISQGMFEPGAGYGTVVVSSWRQIIDLSNPDASVGTNTVGQSGNPASPHYRDQIDDWSTWRGHPLPLSRAEVDRIAESTAHAPPGRLNGLTLPPAERRGDLPARRSAMIAPCPKRRTAPRRHRRGFATMVLLLAVLLIATPGARRIGRNRRRRAPAPVRAAQLVAHAEPTSARLALAAAAVPVRAPTRSASRWPPADRTRERRPSSSDCWRRPAAGCTRGCSSARRPVPAAGTSTPSPDGSTGTRTACRPTSGATGRRRASCASGRRPAGRAWSSTRTSRTPTSGSPRRSETHRFSACQFSIPGPPPEAVQVTQTLGRLNGPVLASRRTSRCSRPRPRTSGRSSCGSSRPANPAAAGRCVLPAAVELLLHEPRGGGRRRRSSRRADPAHAPVVRPTSAGPSTTRSASSGPFGRTDPVTRYAPSGHRERQHVGPFIGRNIVRTDAPAAAGAGVRGDRPSPRIHLGDLDRSSRYDVSAVTPDGPASGRPVPMLITTCRAA